MTERLAKHRCPRFASLRGRELERDTGFEPATSLRDHETRVAAGDELHDTRGTAKIGPPGGGFQDPAPFEFVFPARRRNMVARRVEHRHLAPGQPQRAKTRAPPQGKMVDPLLGEGQKADSKGTMALGMTLMAVAYVSSLSRRPSAHWSPQLSPKFIN